MIQFVPLSSPVLRPPPTRAWQPPYNDTSLAAAVTCAVTVSADLQAGISPVLLQASKSSMHAQALVRKLATIGVREMTQTVVVRAQAQFAASVTLAITTAAALDAPGTSIENVLSRSVNLPAQRLLEESQWVVVPVPAVGAVLGADITLAAAVSCAITVSAPLTAAIRFASAVSVAVTVAAPMTTAIQFTASPTLAITVSAPLTALIAFASDVGLAITTTGSLEGDTSITAAVACAVTATAGLSAGITFAADVALALEAEAALVIPIEMAADVALALFASADLSVSAVSGFFVLRSRAFPAFTLRRVR